MAEISRVLLPGVLILAAAAPLHALDFKDGRWRVTIETETRGIAVKMPPKYQYEHCLTQKDFKPDLAPLHSSCKTTDLVTEGSQVTWKFACREKGAGVQGQGKLKFSGTRFEGEVNTISEYPQRFEVTQYLRGRYLGVCDQRGKTQPGKPAPQMREYDERK